MGITTKIVRENVFPLFFLLVLVILTMIIIKIAWRFLSVRTLLLCPNFVWSSHRLHSCYLRVCVCVVVSSGVCGVNFLAAHLWQVS